jgi:hypothetical protein
VGRKITVTLAASIKDAHETVQNTEKTLILLTFPWRHLLRKHNTKRKVAQAAFSFCTLHFSLFTLHFSLNPPRDFSREEIREKREKKRELFSCAFGALVEKH